MKMPKFIKHSGSHQLRSSSTAARGLNASTLLAASQLLLTDDICRFTPQKKPTTANSTHQHQKLADKRKSKEFVETNSFMFVSSSQHHKLQQQTPSTPKHKLFQFESSTSAALPVINLFGSAQVTSSGGAGRFAKSSQPKRLQRNRLQHVNAKPSNYVLRSTLSTGNDDDAVDSRLVSFLFILDFDHEHDDDDDDDDKLIARVRCSLIVCTRTLTIKKKTRKKTQQNHPVVIRYFYELAHTHTHTHTHTS